MKLDAIFNECLVPSIAAGLGAASISTLGLIMGRVVKSSTDPTLKIVAGYVGLHAFLTAGALKSVHKEDRAYFVYGLIAFNWINLTCVMLHYNLASKTNAVAFGALAASISYCSALFIVC